MGRYILLHDNISYDWDDYEKYGAVLYDCVEHKAFSCGYGHGYDLEYRDDLISLKEALSMGIVSENEIKQYIVKAFGLSFEKIDLCGLACSFSQSNPMSIPVTIVRGRKGKGKKGRLIYGETKRNYYGWGAYHQVFDEFAYVLLNDSNEVIKVNSFDYLKVDENYIAEYNKVLPNEIVKAIELSQLSWLYAYKMSYSSCDKDNLRYRIDDFSRLAKGLYKAKEDVLQAIKAYQDECDRIATEQREALKKEVMPQLIDWVLKNTDKQGDEVEKLALHIFNKRY